MRDELLKVTPPDAGEPVLVPGAEATAPAVVEKQAEEFLAAYNVSEDGGFYAVFGPTFFQGKNFVFESRVRDFMGILWDVRDGKIKATR